MQKCFNQNQNNHNLKFNIINIDKLFAVSEPIPPAEIPYTFNTKDFELPKTYFFEDKEQDLASALEHFKTDGLIVLHQGDMLYENYWNNNSAASKHIAFSVSKSFLSALIGIAVHDGLIDNIEDPITKYLPDFNGTGYEGVSIKNILQMSSGVEFNEDYADPQSDINKFRLLVFVAIALMRCIQLSTKRSAVNMEIEVPSTINAMSPDLTLLPSSILCVNFKELSI